MIGQAENHCARQEAKQTWDHVIQFAFAATGGASAWSVSGECHAHAEDQAANKIPNDVGPGDIREGEQS